jgi:hypothetical protein
MNRTLLWVIVAAALVIGFVLYRSPFNYQTERHAGCRAGNRESEAPVTAKYEDRSIMKRGPHEERFGSTALWSFAAGALHIGARISAGRCFGGFRAREGRLCDLLEWTPWLRQPVNPQLAVR